MAEEAIPYVMMALGTAAQMKAQGDANSERNNILRMAGEETSKLTKKAIDTGQEGAQKYNATTRLADEDQAGQAAEGSLVKALTDAQVKQEPNTGKVSDDYLTSQARTTSDTMGRSAKLAQLMAKVRAPTDLRFKEGLSNADTASRIAAITGDARGASQAGGVDASGVGPDQGLMMLGGLGQTAGVGMAAGYKPKPAIPFYGAGGSPY